MLITIVISLIFLSILIVGHELGHFLAARAFRVRVEEFGIGFPPKLFAKRIGETNYSLNILPFGGFVRIYGEHRQHLEEIKDIGRSFVHQPIFKRAIIMAAGVVANFLIGWLAFSVVFFSLGTPEKIIIGEVIPNSPAAAAGLQAGEEISGYRSANEFLADLNLKFSENKPISINNKLVTPRSDPTGSNGQIGIKIQEIRSHQHNPFQSLVSGLQTTFIFTGLLVKAFGNILTGVITGNFTFLNQVAGPVGIFSILGEVKNLGAIYLVELLGFISINLMIVNLIPFPALDGGRLLLLLFEKIISRPINYKIEMAINAVGIALLLLLMLVVTYRDIMRL